MINECAIVPDDEAIEKAEIIFYLHIYALLVDKVVGKFLCWDLFTGILFFDVLYLFIVLYFATEPTSTRSSRCSVLTSRQSSTEDPFDWEHIAHTLRGTAVFDELSPIEENSSVDRLLFDRTNETDRICNEPNSMNVSQQRTRFMRATSETERDLLISHLSQTVLPRKTMQIVRRNSSPSVSMFGVNTRDRVSPQAVQDLLELSRLGGSRRAASPDSMRSSRSPSPPTSSGRTSPGWLISTLLLTVSYILFTAMPSLSSLSRLKVSSSSLGGGMRKLSSSPHLLGICEEGEEIEQGGSGSLLTTSWAGMARTNRLSFFCRLYLPLLVWSIYVMDQYKQQRVPDHILSRLLTADVIYGINIPEYMSYLQCTNWACSAVRMIRPRHAVVSPDVCRRYEQHQRFVVNNAVKNCVRLFLIVLKCVVKFSCSSSEASDDEEGKRLSIKGPKYCGRKRDPRRDKDENDGDQGGISGSTGQSDTSVAITNRSQGGENTTEGSSSTQERRSGPSDACTSNPVQHLLPIPEINHLDNDKDLRIRATSQKPRTAKQILNHWSGMLPHLSIQDESWHGISRKQLSYTDNINQSNNIYYNDWIRKIQRTRSIEDIIMLQSGSHDISMNMDDSLLSFLDSLCPPSITDNDEETDSSCSSRKDMLKRNVKDETKLKVPFGRCYMDPHLIYDQPRYEKVNDWLHSGAVDWLPSNQPWQMLAFLN
uniref:Bestrophin homolog n=1 Tax=Heterorhabditis bacteriophora TaxID=37862 RepID=A0A1I7X0J8_HETBA